MLTVPNKLVVLLGCCLLGAASAAPGVVRTHEEDGLLWQLAEPPVVDPVLAEGALQSGPKPKGRVGGVLALSEDDERYIQQVQASRNAEAFSLVPRVNVALDEALTPEAVFIVPRSVQIIPTRDDRSGRKSVVAKPTKAPVYVQVPGASTRGAFRGVDRIAQSSLSLGPSGFSSGAGGNGPVGENTTHVLHSPAARAQSFVVSETSSGEFKFGSFSTQPTAASGALDTFGTITGWSSRDGEMTVSHNATGGNPGGALQGNFASQLFPIPQTDSFILSSGSGSPSREATFLGDYRALTLNPAQLTWSFDFKAEDILPSDLVFRFSDGANTFFRSFASDVTTVGVWQQVYVPLNYADGWNGGSLSDFNSALYNIDSIEIQITRRGTGDQTYLVDNLQIIDFSIPEPSTAGFLAFGALAIVARRWVYQSRRRARNQREG